MSIADFDRLMKAQYQLANADKAVNFDSELLDILRLSGQYEVIVETLK